MTEKETRYKLTGKILYPLEQKEFLEKMKAFKGKNIKLHRPFVAFLYYYGVRISEALKILKENTKVSSSYLEVDIGERLKHSKRTPPLVIRINRPYVHEIAELIEEREPEERLFPFHRVTGWRVVRRSFKRYPHYFRLNRITDLFERGFTLTQIRNWTGLSLQSLEYYIGIVDIRKIGKAI